MTELTHFSHMAVSILMLLNIFLTFWQETAKISIVKISQFYEQSFSQINSVGFSLQNTTNFN